MDIRIQPRFHRTLSGTWTRCAIETETRPGSFVHRSPSVMFVDPEDEFFCGGHAVSYSHGRGVTLSFIEHPHQEVALAACFIDF